MTLNQDRSRPTRDFSWAGHPPFARLSRSRGGRWSTGACWAFGICLALALVWVLYAFSNFAQPVVPMFFAAVALAAVGIGWLVIVVVALVHKQRPPTIALLAPVLVLIVFGASFSDLAWKARWILSEPAFNAVVERAGPAAPIAPPGADLDEDEGWTDLEPCRSVIGLYGIRSCSGIPGGYVFYDNVGSGLIDDGGVAYLPYGIPPDAGTGWFESPEFVHLHGDWYAFAASW